jgi:hypothetical protein
MTLARQGRKARLHLFAAMLVATLAAGVGRAMAEQVVIDPQSGLAISGFDPVAYFTESSAKEGRAEVEFNSDGVTWRFRNEGNRAAFTERPDIYAPRFGGYDPVAIARGASVPGPLYWLVSGQRLYLFYNAKARAAFAAEPDRVLEAAERKWPAVQRTLP